jgi:hypothetical protein
MITITGNEVVSLGLSACAAVLILEVLGAKDMGRPEARDRASQLHLMFSHATLIEKSGWALLTSAL